MGQTPSPKRPLKTKTIYLVAEGTGETISKIAGASLSIFDRENVEVKHFFLVDSKREILNIIKQAIADDAMITFTVVQPGFRDFLIRESERHGLKAIDVIGNFIVQLTIFLGEKPVPVRGRQYVLDEAYFRRIEAINFAVKHDDGKMPEGLIAADLILVGLSRTGKTPLATYMANKGWKVANIPLHMDLTPPEELFQVDYRKIFGLTINVESLVKLRQARLKQLGLESHAKYADAMIISDEIKWCNAFFNQYPNWRIIDVSNKAIEEIAASIGQAFKNA